ncbi:MAG: hypothetical protein JW937_01195 [Candidatus Omnitrophica bacterium]|nr:hypothetical protein [Candidatus Omnitrophota bacterium]
MSREKSEREHLVLADLSSWGQRGLRDYEVLSKVPQLGIWHLPLRDAARLIAVDKWMQGEIEAEIPEEELYNPKDPKLVSAVIGYSEKFEKALVDAIQGGNLKPAFCRRSLDGAIDAENTFVGYEALREWVGQFGHNPGQAFDKYEEDEAGIVASLIDEVRYLREVGYTGLGRVILTEASRRSPLSDDLDKLRAVVKELLAENAHLRTTLQQMSAGPKDKLDQPLGSRHRRTLLGIMAAFCMKAGVDPRQRALAQRVRKWTETVGANVSYQAILPVLKDVAEVMEAYLEDKPLD